MALVQHPEPKLVFEAFIDSGLKSDFEKSPETVALSQELPDLNSVSFILPDTWRLGYNL